MSDNNTFVVTNVNDTRRNHNRFWLSKKGRDLGGSSDLDKIVKSWIWTNEGYGKRGQLVVDTLIGYTWGVFPGNEEGLARMKRELKGHKIWSTYEDGEDLHILVIGSVKEGRDRPAPKRAGRSAGRGRLGRRI